MHSDDIWKKDVDFNLFIYISLFKTIQKRVKRTKSSFQKRLERKGIFNMLRTVID